MTTFLRLGAWAAGGEVFEIASRRKLDSRQVVPFFTREGRLHVGLLQRARPSRALRGAPETGLEAIGFDFAGVDETADVTHYGRAIFSERAGVEVDDDAHSIAPPSFARSIGYLTELVLPLLLPVKPPQGDEIDVSWDGGHHRVLFRPLDEVRRLLDSDDGPPHGEELGTLLGALAVPAADGARAVEASRDADAWVARQGSSVWSADRLATALAEPAGVEARRIGDVDPERLAFLRFHRVEHDGHAIELVTPGTGVSVALLPYVVASDGAYFVLWNELRFAALERRALQPLYDLPVPLRYANATGVFIKEDQQRLLASDPRALAGELLSRALGANVAVTSVERLGPGAEPANSVSTEVRHRLACAIEPSSLRALAALPGGAFLIRADELGRATSRGLVKDPVIVRGLLALASRLRVDPFLRARSPGSDTSGRRAFIDRMTEGSIVQRRLRGYSSIEREQLESTTYARLMTLLQHEFGLRIVFPQAEKDRAFFKAAYRVFMAADRGEDRALQGLHFSHDAFHFALGNFAPPAPPDFDEWYASGAAAAERSAEPEGEDWRSFYKALKHAENEATFFSFFTLFAEHLPLAAHVGRLTFYEAMRDMGFGDRASAWPLYLEVVHEARLPDAVTKHPVFGARKDVRDLFEYMLGFRDYQAKDIATAWRFAVKEPYRGYTTRFGIYESELGRYLDGVHGFAARLASYPPGYNPLLAACADVRVDLSLRVWDVVKALKLLRAASVAAKKPVADAERRGFLVLAEDEMKVLFARKAELALLRARVTDAEITPDNEDTHRAVAALSAKVEAARQSFWDRVEGLHLLEPKVIAEERTRELPR
jgi:hypothetical protein